MIKYPRGGTSCQRVFCVVLVTCLPYLTSCSKKGDSPGQTATTGRVSPTYDGPAEWEYCTGPKAYSDSVTISGRAQYQYRETFYSSPSSGGLGSPSSPQAIRRAEVRATTSTGELMDCTETDDSGAFSLSLPRGDGLFTVSILSRANNQFLKATVFNAPEQNIIYSLNRQVVSSVSQDMGSVVALATTDDGLLGGAFNILDQMLKANDFIRSKAGNCGSIFSGCPNFTVAPKVRVYWEPGFDPGSYFESSSPLSFYLPGYRRLFILGGVSGDVNSSDTDHFDNSVIIHEYGHFLEDAVFVSDSPGGEHNGNKVIDPRLAWSEGWGNFFQAAVSGDSYYIDTVGNNSGSTSLIFRIDLEPNGASASNDRPAFDGEGNFREFSVTRLLFDLNDSASSDPSNDSDSVNDDFAGIWAALTHPSGFTKANLSFRDVGVLHNVAHNILSPNRDWSAIRLTEKHGNISTAFRKEYGQYVSSTVGGCSLSSSPYAISPYDSPIDNGSVATSHLLKNNDFYHYKHAGGPLNLVLHYKTPTGTEADLDLYVYNSTARYGVAEDVVAYGQEEPATATVGDVETESATATSLAAGDYLINVAVYTGNAAVGSDTEYELMVGGINLCPDTLP
ncbi:MAG: hypothetical protein KDD35_07115 [Bdellovibrionales bacterium]|nr:hypothetical protein [Bdellovibrionales bacterium]